MFQWRVKRSSPNGNCTIRVSIDAYNFVPLIPDGQTNFKFPCGRKAGYESAKYTLPKNVVADKGGLIQLEFETELGTIVQCADIIVQRLQPFMVQKCDPACQNGGVCTNGICRCGKMYSGDSCETRRKSNLSTLPS